MSTLNVAVKMAQDAHIKQVRFDGSPYILHLFRVMSKQKTETCRIIAMLHDIVEDTPVGIQDLKNAGFDKEILDAVSLLTRDDSIDYDVYIKTKVCTNKNAIQVKMADIEDNLNILEIPELKMKDFERLIKYHRCWWILKKALG